jgi:hypothetical protein
MCGGGPVRASGRDAKWGGEDNLTQKHKGTKKRDFDRINRIKNLLTSGLE